MSNLFGATSGVNMYIIGVLTANSLVLLSVTSPLNLGQQENQKQIYWYFVTSLYSTFSNV
jgi:hypothetical protein